MFKLPVSSRSQGVDGTLGWVVSRADSPALLVMFGVLQGSPLDLRRKTPLQAGTNTDTCPPRLIGGNLLDTSCAASQLQAPLAPGLQLPSLSKISNVSNASTNASLSEEYSTEAELIGRQIGMLVHLMQVSSAAAAKGSREAAAVAAAAAAAGDVAGADEQDISKGQATREVTRRGSMGGVNAAAVLRSYSSNGARSSNHLAADVLEAACQLLCIQVRFYTMLWVRLVKKLAAPRVVCIISTNHAAWGRGCVLCRASWEDRLQPGC